MSFLFIGFCNYFLFYRTGKERLLKEKEPQIKRTRMVCLLTTKKIAIRECSLFMRRGGWQMGGGKRSFTPLYWGGQKGFTLGKRGVRKVCWFVSFFVLGFKLLQELHDIWKLQRVLQIECTCKLCHSKSNHNICNNATWSTLIFYTFKE